MPQTNDLNVYGNPLEVCSTQPLTGFWRNGCCSSGTEDLGTHTVCAIVTEDFLSFSKSRGNDLSTPRPEYQFQGLVAGNKWCLCVSRWLEAWEADKAPLVNLESTHLKTLDHVPLEVLELYNAKRNS